MKLLPLQQVPVPGEERGPAPRGEWNRAQPGGRRYRSLSLELPEPGSAEQQNTSFSFLANCEIRTSQFSICSPKEFKVFAISVSLKMKNK